MKGTVTTPVVTPPASKAIEKKFLSARHPKVNIRPYPIVSMCFNFLLKMTLKIETIMNSPTPKEAIRISIQSGPDFDIRLESKDKSGSAKVARNPSIPPMIKRRMIDFLFVTLLPTIEPIFAMLFSTPKENSTVPKMRGTEEMIRERITGQNFC